MKKQTEKRQAVLERLGIETKKVHIPKYVMRNGVPHKIVDGQWVPLTKLKK